MLFENKVVLITGAGRGIGRATALAFAKEGAIVVINYDMPKSEAEGVLLEVNKLSKGMIVGCDVTKENEVKQMVELVVKTFGRIDVLVNNAARFLDEDDWNGSPKEWVETLKQDLVSVMITSKHVGELFLKQKSGIIINIASRYSVSGSFDAFAYSAAKAGMISVTQSYSKLLSPFGRANAISPYPVRAGYWLRASKEELEDTLTKIPLKRLLEPEEVAEKIIFYASEQAKNITGQNILVGDKA